MSLKIVCVSARGAQILTEELRQRIQSGSVKNWLSHSGHITHADKQWSKKGYFQLPDSVSPKRNAFDLVFQWPNDMPEEPLSVYAHYHAQFVYMLLTTKFDARLLGISADPNYALLGTAALGC